MDTLPPFGTIVEEDGRRSIANYDAMFSEQEIPFNEKFPGTPEFSDYFIPTMEDRMEKMVKSMLSGIELDRPNRSPLNQLFTFLPDNERKIYAKFLLEAVPALNDIDVHTLIVPIPLDGNHFWTDYNSADVNFNMTKLKGCHPLTTTYLYISPHCSAEGTYGFPDFYNGKVIISYFIPRGDKTLSIYKILKRVFGKQLEWDINDRASAMIINYDN